MHALSLGDGRFSCKVLICSPRVFVGPTFIVSGGSDRSAMKRPYDTVGPRRCQGVKDIFHF